MCIGDKMNKFATHAGESPSLEVGDVIELLYS